MTDQEMWELREKIGRFSDLEYRQYAVRFGGPPTPLTGWYFQNTFQFKVLPDFPHDLNALFRWALPRLYQYHLEREIVYENEQAVGTGRHVASVVGDIHDSEVYTEVADTPALALALAIGKLAEGEKT